MRQVQALCEPGYTADALEPGLNVQVTVGRTGINRSWLFRYTSPVTGRRRELGLGSAQHTSLSDARNRAHSLRQQIADGRDPLEERAKAKAAQAKASRKIPTFAEATAKCIAARKHEWKNAKHQGQWSSTLERYAFPSIGDRLVDEIDIEDVFDLLEPIWTTKTTTATRVRQRIETVLNWAKAHKFVRGENPAALRNGLDQLLPRPGKIKRVRHQPALPYAEAPKLWRALDEKGGVVPFALAFLMLTAARTSEVTGATWAEIDIDDAIWTVPASRMKAGKPHRVPLNAAALDILSNCPVGAPDQPVFPSPVGPRGLSNGAMLRVLKKMPEYAEYVPHGLRSTFRDWASETTSYANETVELALAHAIANKSEAAYRRGDQLEKRRDLMAAWGRFVTQSRSSGNVTNIGVALA